MMQEPKWTPGPWRLGPINYADIYAQDSGELIALAIKGLPDESGVQTVANAVLIAAAPELYEALDAARDELCWLRLHSPGLSGETHERLDKLIPQINAALAKARGTSPESLSRKNDALDSK